MQLEDISEEDEVKFRMKLSKNRRVFTIEMMSSVPMTEKMVIMALEDYLYNNILEGRWPIDKSKEQ